jgi:hypothetical protein
MDPAKQIERNELIKPIITKLKKSHIAILIALSDNEGYAENELSEMIGKRESNLNSLLDELTSNKFGDLEDSYAVRYYHLKDPMSLLRTIQGQRDPVSKYISKNMLGIFDKDYPAYSDLGAMAWDLSIVLDKFLVDKDLYSRERFANIKLSEDAKRLLAFKEEFVDGNIRLLNRILIEDAYPDEICKTRIPLIHLERRRVPNKSKNSYFINLDLRTFHIIADHLTCEIRIDRSRLAERLTKTLLDQWKFEHILIEHPKQKKEIKEDRYIKRLEKKNDVLFNFMVSNYVGKLMKKFGYGILYNIALPWNDLKYEEFLKVSIEKGYIGVDEGTSLGVAFSEKKEAERQFLSRIFT